MSFIRLTFIPPYQSVVPPGGTSRYIIWRPALASSGDFVQTWAEVEAAIAAASGDITVAVEGPATIPAVANTEMFGRTLFVPYTNAIGASTDVTVADGGQIRNLRGITGSLTLHGAPTVTPFLVLDVAGIPFTIREGAQLNLDLGATVPAVDMAASFTELAAFQGGQYNNNAGIPALSLAQIQSGLTVLNAYIQLAGTSGPPAYTSELFAGDGTTTLLQIYDASAPIVAQSNFTGTLVTLPMDVGLGVVYDDSIVPAPSLGVDDVQAAIDVLKVQVAALVPGTYRESLTDADLVLGVLTVTHNLGVRYNAVVFYDNTDLYVLPESVFDVDGNTITADMSTFQIMNGDSIPGTWNVMVSS